MRDILAEECPGLWIALSSEVAPEMREYERTSTTIANAYVQPLMAGYLGRLADAFAAEGSHAPIQLMTSGGSLAGLDTASRFPIRLVESGPAGGAILAAHVAAERQDRKVLSFDMGGTTAKICLIEDMQPLKGRSFEVDRASRFLKGSGLPIRIPVIEMVEIGAGGGSIARVDELQAHHRRAGQRRLGARTRLLRPRRRAADRHRRRRLARQDRSRSASPAARSRSTSRAPRRRSSARSAPRSRSRPRWRPTASVRSSTRTWRTRRACMPSSAASPSRTTRSSPSAARRRSTPRASPRSSASAAS